MRSKSLVGGSLVAAVFWLVSGVAAGQAFPSKPIKIVVPYGPGTAIDVISRIIAEPLSKNVGQPVIVENRPGAAGTVAAAYVVNSPADGYTILTDSSSHTSVGALNPNLPFDPAKDLAGVSPYVESQLVLVVAKSRNINSVKDLVALAKAKPGSITYASAGVGSSTHMTAEKFRVAAGFTGLHVPFKSTTDALTEVVTGRVDFTYTGVASALPFIKDGRLVPLAMNYRHSPALPGVPTIEEAGVPGSAYAGWLAWLVSAKTPRDIVNRLNAELVKVLAPQEMRERLLKVGVNTWTMTPEEFDAMRNAEFVSNAKLVKDAGIRVGN